MGHLLHTDSCSYADVSSSVVTGAAALLVAVIQVLLFRL